MTVTILKLASGTEVVGELKSKNDHSYVMHKPLQINYRYFQGSTPSVSFIRYIMFANSDLVAFSREDVLNVATARDAFADYYLSVVDGYYSKLETLVDKEFRSLLAFDATEKDDPLSSILDMMPIDGATMN